MEKKSSVKTYSFCSQNCCPVVEVENDKVSIGEEVTENGNGGWTTMSRSQFKDLVKAAKSGEFDSIVQ